MPKVKIPRAETVSFAAGHMKKNPEITMPELKKLSKGTGHNIYPLILGLARKELGLKRATPVARRGPGRPAGRRGSGRPPGRRGPGRPRQAGSMVAGLNDVVAHMRGLEKEVTSLRTALGRIGDLAAKV